MRRDGVGAEPQWFAIPADGAEQRLAAFSVDDAAYLRRAPFKSMLFKARGDGSLVVDDDRGSMVYRRQ
ncbi:hypothetical protein BI347_20605 [Chromobacterium sphagni]|uniref:Uncharacterized protein n=1 Tax=Chromobacterium sphagni TaxID=1903179 RepID=A0A1S1WSK4_9NEIS|nr:hypothetical protein BI347_20605 [Chromobacterium sphagni]